MSKFNGHKNWNHWNVSLWINNDEGLYKMTRSLVQCYRYCGGKTAAAKALLEYLPKKTPDGAPYSVSSIRAAMVEM